MTPVKGGGFHRDKSTVAQWIPEPFNLLEGNPFDYSQHSISSVSQTEVFEAGIRTRDGDHCVVCGRTEQGILDYCHIIPKVESDTVRSELLFKVFYRIRTYHGIVGGNETCWFCASNGKRCSA